MAQVPPNTPAATPPPPDDGLQTFIDKIKETIQLDLDEKELDLVIKRRLKKMEDWENMSVQARTAFAHLLAAEVLSDKASDIRMDHAIAFSADHRSAFDDLVTILRNRRKSSSVSVKEKPATT
jgi:hypothetical protein